MTMDGDWSVYDSYHVPPWCPLDGNLRNGLLDQTSLHLAGRDVTRTDRRQFQRNQIMVTRLRQFGQIRQWFLACVRACVRACFACSLTASFLKPGQRGRFRRQLEEPEAEGQRRPPP